MSKNTTSRTEREIFFSERVIGDDGHYKTTITDGDKTRTGCGNKPEEAEARASDKWDKSK